MRSEQADDISLTNNETISSSCNDTSMNDGSQNPPQEQEQEQLQQGRGSVRSVTIAEEEALRFDQRIAEQRNQPAKIMATMEERDAAAKNTARSSSISSTGGSSLCSSQALVSGAHSEISTDGSGHLSRLEQEITAKQQGRSLRMTNNHTISCSQPGAYSVTCNNHMATESINEGEQRLTNLESDVLAKQHGSNGLLLPSTPGAHREEQVATDGGTLQQLSQFKRDVAAKNNARLQSLTGDNTLPGAYPQGGTRGVTLSGASMSGFDALESDVLAENRARLTNDNRGSSNDNRGSSSSSSNNNNNKNNNNNSHMSSPGAFPEPLSPDPSLGLSQLSQLEKDLAAKSRVNPNNVSSTVPPGAYSSTPTTGIGELSQLEQDVAAKNKGRSSTTSGSSGDTGDAFSTPGAHSMGGMELCQLEQEITAKQQAAGASNGSTALNGFTSLNQLESDVVAKNQAARPSTTNSAAGQPGAHSAGQCELSRLEDDIAAKSKDRSNSGNVAATPGVHLSRSSLLPSGGNVDLCTLESDVIAKNRARSGEPTAVGPRADLSTLEQDVTARKSAVSSGTPLTPGAHQFASFIVSGMNDLSSLESDLAAKSCARPDSVGATSSGGDAALSALEEDILAKDRAKLQGQATRVVVPLETLGQTELLHLEQDLIAKKSATTMAAPVSNLSGRIELASLEQDVAIKSRARPSSLTETPLTSELHALENSITQKTPLLLRGSGVLQHYYLEESPLFSRYHPQNSEISMHEISQLDQRIAHKSGNFIGVDTGISGGHEHYNHHHSVDVYGDYAKEDGILRGSSSKRDQRDNEGPGILEQLLNDKDHSETRPGAGEVDVPHQLGDVEYGEMQQNLAVATAIEEEEDDGYIPAAVEFDPDAKPPIFKNRRCRLYGFVGICFIIAVAAVAVVITNVSNGTKRVNEPTSAPTTFRESLGIEEQLIEVFGSRYFEDSDSIQSKALNWLVNDDPYQIRPEAENLIQRFVMVYFYLVTSQDGPWRSCNPPTGKEQDHCFYLYLTDTSSDPWRFSEMYWNRWLTGLHECQWAGITCHSDKVTDISLDGYYLSGTFPVELIKLDYLRDLSLTHNNFMGPLPKELAEMKHLTDIELQANKFTGAIPQEWYGAKNLIHINVGSNQLEGTIPTEFGRLTDLQRCFFQNNRLSGPLPMELFELTSLKWFFIANNKFSGSIPSEVGRLTNLEYFSIYGNPFSGTLPSEVGLLTEMREIDLHDTEMEGTIPEEIFEGMSLYLNLFDVSSARFSGTLSTRIGLLQTVDWFLVPYNNFTGTIPTEAAAMSSLNRFNVQGNDFSGEIPAGLCLLRGEMALRDVKADCATIGTGETPVYCPAGCCSECCNKDTGICLPTAG